MTEARLVLTTAGSKEEAQKLASAVVSAHLAACVNIAGPMESHYWWKEKVESSAEFLLVIKTTAAKLEPLRAKIHELHSYELPEFIVLNIEAGDTQYLGWLAASVNQG